MQLLEDKRRKAGRSAAWYTVSSLLTKGLGFITIPLFTRVMTAEEFGLFNNFAAWQIILLAVFSLESYATLNRARLDFKGKALQDYQFTLLTCSMSLTFLLALLLVCAPAVPELFTDLDRQYLYMMVLYLLFYPAFNMFQSLQRVQYRYKLSAGLSIVVSLAATFLSVALVLYLPDALMGRILGQYVPFALLGFAFYLWYWKSGGSFKLEYLKYALPLCVPLIVTTLGSQMLLLGCRIVTQHTCGANEVAFLSLATTLSNIVLILVKALDNAWSPWLYDCLESREYDRAAATFKLYLWATTTLTIAVSLMAPELVMMLGGEGYKPTVWLVPSFMAVCQLGMLANQYVLLETYHKDVRIGGVAALLFGILNLPLCVAFVTVFGFESIGYANVISSILLIGCHCVIVRKFDTPNIFSLKTIGLPCALSLAAIPICLMLYYKDIDLVRYALFVLLTTFSTAVLIKSKKKMKSQQS